MFDPRRPTLRRRIDRGDAVGLHWLAMGSVAMVELAARARPDAIVLDLQHGLWERGGMEAAIAAVPPDIPVIVRVAENSALAISQALDAGAEGVMVPLVETGRQAAKAVRHARFPPHGERSGGGVRPLSDFVAYVEGAERGIVVIVMIETQKGVANAREIARTEGVDMVFLGTGDLSLSLGTFPGNSPRHEEACAAVQAECRRAWTPCGIFTGQVEGAIARRRQGYRMTVLANDIEVVSRGFATAAESYAAAKALPPPRPAPVHVLREAAE